MGNIITHPTVFEKCLELLNLKNFRCPYSDTGAKKLLSGAAILLLIAAEMQKIESLSEIELNLRLNESVQTVIGLDSIHGSSIFRKLENLPTGTLHNICYELFERIHEGNQGKKKTSNLGKLKIIDSSEIALPNKAGEWAYCSKSSNGIKLHLRLVVLDEETIYPDHMVLSTNAVSDQEGAVELVVESDAIYVMDRGYINYQLYRDWLKQGILFVARIKGNSKTKIILQRAVSEDSYVVTDADVEITIPKTDETFILRLIEYKDDKNRLYRVVTSCWKHSAEEIAEIYKKRWLIELFFKWIKGHLNTVKFFNHKPEAVWNQIYISMIAYALCELIRMATNTKLSNWEVLKRLRLSWLLPWDKFDDELNRKPKRTSKGREKKAKRGRPRKHEKKLKAVQIVYNPTK